MILIKDELLLLPEDVRILLKEIWSADVIPSMQIVNKICYASFVKHHLLLKKTEEHTQPTELIKRCYTKQCIVF